MVLHIPLMVSFVCGQEGTENLANNGGASKAMTVVGALSKEHVAEMPAKGGLLCSHVYKYIYIYTNMKQYKTLNI